MRTAGREKVYITHGRDNQASLTVAPGETFAVETELCSGPWLQTIVDQYEPDNTVSPNPAVVISVASAKPGDCLAVRILGIDVDQLGYTGFVSPANPLARLILDQDWGRNTRTLAIEDGEIIWNDHLRIPIRPMIGTLGTAPDREVPAFPRAGRGDRLTLRPAPSTLPFFRAPVPRRRGDVPRGRTQELPREFPPPEDGRNE